MPGAEIAEAYVLLRADTDKLRSDVKSAARSVSKDMGDASDGVGGKFKSMAKTAGGTILKIGAAGSVVAAGGFALMGKAALTSGADIETASLTLTGLYGNAKLAKDTLAGLKDVASKSPIDYQSYLKAGESLAYAGIKGKDATGILKNVGLEITAVGGDSSNMDSATAAILKMVNAGKVSLDSLQQLSDSGVPIMDGLAAHFGVSIDQVNKMATNGQIGLKDVTDVMQQGTGDVAQSMIASGKKATDSFSNQWKIAKDNLNTTLGSAMQPVMGTLTTSLQGVVAAIGPSLSTIASGLASAFSAIAPIIGPVMGMIASAFAQLAPIIGPIITQLGGALLSAMKAFQPVMPVIIGLVGTLASVLAGGLSQAISVLAPVIAQIVVALAGGLMQVLKALMPVLPPLIGAIGTIAQAFGGAFAKAIQVLAPIIAKIAGALGGVLAKAMKALTPILPPLMKAFGEIADMIGGAFMDVLDALLPVLPTLTGAFTTLIKVGLRAIMPILEALMAAFKPLIPPIVKIAGMLAGAFTKAITALMPVLIPLIVMISKLAVKLINALAPILPVLIQALMPLIPLFVQIVDVVAKLAELILPPLVSLLGVILPPIITVLVGVIKGLAWVFTNVIIPAITSVISWIADHLKPVIHGIGGFFTSAKNVITDVIGKIVRVVKGIVDKISGPLKRITSVVKAPFKLAFDWLGLTLVAVIGWVTGIPGKIAKGLSGLKNIITSAFKGALNGMIGIINTAIGFINTKLIDNANKVPFVNIPHIPKITKIGAKKNRYAGGPIPGRGPVPILGHGGEYVLSADVVQAIRSGRPSRGLNANPAGTSPGGSVVFEKGAIDARGLDPDAAATVISQDLSWRLSLAGGRR